MMHMIHTNPILEEAWRIKDELAEEAGHDVRVLADQTRQWASTQTFDNPVVRDAEELRRLYEVAGSAKTPG